MPGPSAGRSSTTGQPVGAALPEWTPRPRPSREPMEGRYCRLEPLDAARHADDLFKAYALDEAGAEWTYLPYGPFTDADEHRAWIARMSETTDPLFFAILNKDGTAVGVASYLRIDGDVGCIEVGHIHYSSLLQRTRAATEAMYLMARRAFDELGYRRYEWKCDELNAPSRAAERLGFTYEGTFRQHRIYKGRNRDTAWYSITDAEWPRIRAAMEAWLDPSNFDESGQQRTSLAAAR